MGKRQMAKPRRQSVKRVECDALLYTTEDGERLPLRAGQWVEFKARMTARDIRQLLAFGELTTTSDLSALGEQFGALVAFLAEKVATWNWQDIDGDYAPLPEPSAETLAALDLEDLLALLDMYASMTNPEKKALSPS